jgi:release factor glutamine methyltransferase
MDLDLFTSARPPTVRQALHQVRAHLVASNIEEAEVLAEWVVAEVLHMGRAEVRASFNAPMDGDPWTRAMQMVQRLCAGEPWAYVCGWTQFRQLRLTVDRRALIPRPETEELVEHVLHRVRAHALRRICDVGTGSGCIALSLACECPTTEVVGTDVSAKALELASNNSRELWLHHRVTWLHVSPDSPVPPGPWDLIVSNPPYVRTAVWDTLPATVRNWEPRVALDGGVDGMEVIRTIVREAARQLCPRGYLALEIGEDQGDDVRALVQTYAFSDVQILRDTGGRERILIAQHNG